MMSLEPETTHNFVSAKMGTTKTLTQDTAAAASPSTLTAPSAQENTPATLAAFQT